MGTFLLHNPWIQFYLLYAGALWIAFLWDYLRRSPATRAQLAEAAGCGGPRKAPALSPAPTAKIASAGVAGGGVNG
jgi:hypothetical protein